jgi:hypothetical protein
VAIIELVTLQFVIALIHAAAITNARRPEVPMAYPDVAQPRRDSRSAG